MARRPGAFISRLMQRIVVDIAQGDGVLIGDFEAEFAALGKGVRLRRPARADDTRFPGDEGEMHPERGSGKHRPRRWGAWHRLALSQSDRVCRRASATMPGISLRNPFTSCSIRSRRPAWSPTFSMRCSRSV